MNLSTSKTLFSLSFLATALACGPNGRDPGTGDSNDGAADALTGIPGADAEADRTSPAGATNPEGGAEAIDATSGASITGTVVDRKTLKPLAGRTVAIAGQKTTTGPGGKFSLANVPAAYDAVVIDP